MASMKEIAIRDYIAKIDFRKDWSYNKIEEDMRKFLGERPSLHIDYVKDVMLNETTGEAKEIKRINTFSVVFKDLDNKFTPEGHVVLTKIDIIID
jgi:hypothetical protein